MKIVIEKEAYSFPDDASYSENYNINATVEFPDDATSYDVLKGCMKAMLIEGYQLKSIVRDLKELSEVEAFESGISLEDEGE